MTNEFPYREKPRTLKLTLTVDITICYERIVNSIIATLPPNYEHFEDVFELKHLLHDLDNEIRSLSTYKEH